jgi:hypothetical protein
MELAVANILSVTASNVVLTFKSVVLEQRRQQTGVLVSVGIINFLGSAASYVSKISQDKVNAEITALGLNSIKLVSIAGVS